MYVHPQARQVRQLMSENFLQKKSRQALVSLEFDPVYATPALSIKTESCLWLFSDILNMVTHKLFPGLLGEMTFVATPQSCQGYLPLVDINNCPVQAGSLLGKHPPWVVYLEKNAIHGHMLGPGFKSNYS